MRELSSWPYNSLSRKLTKKRKGRMKKLFVFLFMLVIAVGISGYSDAKLWDRGGGLIYDDVLNVTWLQDANYAKTAGTVFDPNGDGIMGYEQAKAWANSLNYYDSVRDIVWSDWRLPNALPVNGSDYNYVSNQYNGSGDTGYNISAEGSMYAGTKQSEMAYLFYNSLGATGQFDVNGNIRSVYGLYEKGTTPFINLQLDAYWSIQSGNTSTLDALYFNFAQGVQKLDTKLHTPGFYAWAVLDGDVVSAPSTVPEPATMLLVGFGLLGIEGFRRKFQ